MLREIDLNKKTQKPKIQVAKPNRTIIGNLKEAFQITHSTLLGQYNELSFTIPYDIDKNHNLVRNPNIDKLKDRYLLKLTWGSDYEWYIINENSESMGDNSDSKSVHAFSLQYELKDKLVREYEVESYTLNEVTTDALQDTLWSIGTISVDFISKYRSFSVSEKSVLDFIYEIAETFGAILKFDTETRTINFLSESDLGTNRGFKVSYGKYLKTLNKTSNPDEMVTRLKVYGKDGLSINRVNATGSNYIESFSYFMYPFDAVKRWVHIKDKKWSDL